VLATSPVLPLNLKEAFTQKQRTAGVYRRDTLQANMLAKFTFSEENKL